MRGFAVLVGIMALTPICAGAQTTAVAQAAADRALSDEAFVNSAPRIPSDPGVTIRSGQDALAQGGVFATPDFVGEGLTGQPVPTARVAATGEGLIAWRSSEISRLAPGGAVDSIRLSQASVSRTLLPGADAVFDPAAVNVSVVRGWPAAVLLNAGPVGVSLTPHAGFGVGSGGGSSAEAGAMVKVSSLQGVLQDRLAAMGVKSGSSTFGNQGRWYLFAAVQGRAVGMNLQETGGALRRVGWSTDVSSALIGDGQVGVGWRKGGIEASFGYVHRDVRMQGAPVGASDSYSDNMAALAFTYRPHW